MSNRCVQVLFISELNLYLKRTAPSVYVGWWWKFWISLLIQQWLRVQVGRWNYNITNGIGAFFVKVIIVIIFIVFFVVVTLFGRAMTVGIVMVDRMIEIVICSSIIINTKKCIFILVNGFSFFLHGATCWCNCHCHLLKTPVVSYCNWHEHFI